MRILASKRKSQWEKLIAINILPNDSSQEAVAHEKDEESEVPYQRHMQDAIYFSHTIPILTEHEIRYRCRMPRLAPRCRRRSRRIPDRTRWPTPAPSSVPAWGSPKAVGGLVTQTVAGAWGRTWEISRGWDRAGFRIRRWFRTCVQPPTSWRTTTGSPGGTWRCRACTRPRRRTSRRRGGSGGCRSPSRRFCCIGIGTEREQDWYGQWGGNMLTHTRRA